MNNIQGTEEEIAFWKTFVHSAQFKNWLDESQPCPELLPEVVRLIREEKDNITVNHPILDVGSGVISLLRGTVPQALIQTTDLLADEYAKFFDYAEHSIPKPLTYAAENIPFVESFPVVHMSNALDHCQNPIIAFNRLCAAVMPGGLLIIQGFENEGTHMKRYGMHQWDITLVGDRLTLTPATGHAVLTLSDIDFKPISASITLLENGRNWFMWAARKTKYGKA